MRPRRQVVDTKGAVLRLNRLTLKDETVNRSIMVPADVPDVARIQMWCARAEVLLGKGQARSGNTAPLSRVRADLAGTGQPHIGSLDGLISASYRFR